MQRLIRLLFRRLIRLYFRDVSVVGEQPLPTTEGRLFAANHVNGLVDPVLVLTSAHCNISPVGKAPLWKIPVVKWLLESVDAVPIVRRRDDPTKSTASNDEVFQKVGEHLGRGGNILIFPEGTSHNEPHLLPLRSGAARMLDRGRAIGPKTPSFQCVGLEFDARATFRSRALVIFGPVHDVASLTPEQITEQIDLDLHQMLLGTDDWDDRLLVARVAQLFANEANERDVARFFERARAIIDLRAALNNSDLVAVLRARISHYFSRLEEVGLSDDEIAGVPLAERTGGLFRAIWMVLLLPFAVMGVFLYFIPYQLPRLVARKASTDVASTYKLGVGLIAFPIWFALLTALSAIYLDPATKVKAIVVLFISPFAALLWLDRQDKLVRRVRWAMLGGKGTFEQERTDLITALIAAREKAEASA